MVDRDRSGFIDENELQQALFSGYQKFSLRTIRLLIFLFKSPNDPLRVGPKEFASSGLVLVNGDHIDSIHHHICSTYGCCGTQIEFSHTLPICNALLSSQRFRMLHDSVLGIFERYDKDRSGKIDLMELRDALYSLGLAIPPSVLQLLISKYDDGSGSRVELNFDSFVECGMIVKGLTDKFKEKDLRYTGSATINYDTFMSMVIPFLVSYN
ncbi:putative calcium-binding protein CML48 [Prunus yedoensis var. nudiflora]|uniref:Putative calcium-binding protein CML48 n=1 Tax=Prunus yedoensis var. nudiflora TaxID=2094558 RepID=A0A314UQY5_PRUYE|nr:putative calcium-binding protein CML48 [Prunus yedoensis var. nudiflora]